MKSLRVIVGCEFSGVVRDAFLKRGHDAWSCDLLPSESIAKVKASCCNEMVERHIIGDLLSVLASPFRWDLAIFHPPCTYLTNAGVRWLYKNGKGTERDPARWEEMQEAARFFEALRNADIPRICVENPIMHSYARELISGEPSQIIQPWQFGHGETKATCLWLKNLPKLIPTDIVSGRQPRVHHASPGPHRWKERSRTLPGIAAAMAAQWSA